MTKGVPMRITVLSGGDSPEREVSLNSGAAVARALTEFGHDARAVDLTSSEDLFALLASDRPEFAFIALHGGWGEDGAVQAVLEMAGVPFSGAGHEACALAMDKAASKALFHWRKVPSPRELEVPRGTSAEGLEGDGRLADLLERSGKLVVKPCSCGSTVGVSILQGTKGLQEALDLAFRFDRRALVEEYVPGKELTVTVWEPDGRTECLPVIEIRPKVGVYDYASKYTPGATEYLVPAPLSAEVTCRVQEASAAAHEALGCSVYSRVDLRMDEDDIPLVLEVNTAPGMTATSLVPKAAAAVGLSFGAFLDSVVRQSLDRFAELRR